MHVKRCLASALGIGLVCSAGAFGQSMIEYGHGVAKAGVAGAASGTGIAGIFTNMKDVGDDDKKDTRRYTTDKTEQPETDSREEWREPGEPANAPLKMKTSNGVVVSGVSPSWTTAAYRDPVREPVRVRSVEWTNSAEEQAVIVEQEAAAAETGTVEQAAGTEAPVAVSQEVAGAPEVAGPARIVSGDHALSGSAVDLPAESWRSPHAVPQALEPVTDAEVAGIRIGSRIEEAIEVLGRPTFSFTGIVGKGYSEKYVFKKANGETITVLTWTGIVTSVLLS